MRGYCINCGRELPPEAGFCPKCGTKVETFCCPSCGKELDFGADFCIYCGQRLKEEAPMAEPEQEASAPPEETTSQSELKAPKEEKRSEPAEKAPTSEAAEPAVEDPAPGAETAESSDAPKGFTWCYTEGADEQSHMVSIRIEGSFLYIVEGLFLTTNAEADFAARQNEGLAGQKIDLSEIKNVEIDAGYLVITKWSGSIIRVKGQESEPEILREAATTILSRIGKDPSKLREEDPGESQKEPLDDQPQEFTWSHKKPQGRVGSAVTTVKVWLEREMLHIQKEFSDTITTHKNTLPEETIPLSEIESVYIQKRGMSVSVILLLLCVALVLYGGVSGRFDLGTTTGCLLCLVVIFALRYRSQMNRCQLVIVKKDGKKITLEGDGDSLQTMDEVAEAILTRAGIDPGIAQLTEKRAGHKPIWIILGVVAVLLLGVLIVPELYLKQSFPAGVIQNQDVMDYVGTEINGDLNYQVTAEVTDGKLVKNTAMPQYEDGLFTYYFVGCIYDVTVKDDNGESASGQVTVDCSFSVKPFNDRPEDIVFNSFTYSDELETFINERSSTLPDGLPMDFYLSGSAGNWSTSVTLYSDGSFSGGFSNMDMGVFYTNTFVGRFSDIKRMNDYTYVMTVSELDLDKTPGEEWYGELGHMVAAKPAGVEMGETFYLYLPQAPMAELELPPEFMMNWYDGNGVTLGCFGLYGKTQDFGYMFSGEKVNTGNDTYGSDPGYTYDSDYILPTDTQYITEYDLYGLTKEEVVLARNEIYARYGYSFQSENIRVYFAAQPWYHEDTSVNANTFGTAQMNDYERANLETIQQYEKDMGWK